MKYTSWKSKKNKNIEFKVDPILNLDLSKNILKIVISQY